MNFSREEKEFDPDFLDREWHRTGESAPNDSFSILTWNLQADKMKYGRGSRGGDGGRLRPGEDRIAVEACIAALLGRGHSIGLSSKASIVMLQELQQCSRHLKRGDCRNHDNLSCFCPYDHASWVHNTLNREGYCGTYHAGKANTVGLYYRTDIWDNITDSSGRNTSKHLFVTFDGSYSDTTSARDDSAVDTGELAVHTNKGAVLAVLRHRCSGDRILAVAVHLSVPKDREGNFVPGLQLGELAQLAAKIRDVMARHGDMVTLIAGDMNCTAPLCHRRPRPPAAAAFFDQSQAPTFTSATATTFGGPSDVAPPLALIRLTEEWGLASAYASLHGGTSPAYSSVSPTFRHCIDHIVATPARLLPIAVLDVKANFVDMPAPYPSDHLPMAAEYRFVSSLPIADDVTMIYDS